ncbi:MAG: homoserine kinase [Cyclobacteriaceae bacterium]
MQKVTAFAPATVANVSCGFDILGFAVDDIGDKVSVSLSKTPGIRMTKIEGDQGKLPYEANKNTCGVAIKAMLDTMDFKDGLEVELYKGLPLGSGMGSSAASAVAALVATNRLLGNIFDKTELLPFAMESERIACGTGHADNVSPALLGGFVLIREYHPLDVIPLNVPRGLYCTLVHPHLVLNTSDSRSVLRRSVSLKDATTQSGNIAGLVAGLFQEDMALISRSLNDVIAEPSRSVLIPGYDEVKQGVKSVGALGCGISGSGPTIFILSPTEEIAWEVSRMAQEVFDKIELPIDLYVSAINTRGAYIIEEEG